MSERFREVGVTSRAAEAELERQRVRREAAEVEKRRTEALGEPEATAAPRSGEGDLPSTP